MKKIIVCTGDCTGENFKHNTLSEHYDIKEVKPELIENEAGTDIDFAIINADISDINVPKIINTLKKFGTKIWAYSIDTSRKNILKLYTEGFDNVVPAPYSMNALIEVMINPDNSEVNLEDSDTYKNSKKVLIVSDDKLNTELLLYTFDDFDFLYTIRTNLHDAIREISKDHYDLIIIDCVNPDDEIFDAAEYICQSMLNRTTPFIFISAKPETQSLIKGYQLGSYAYLEKPYNIDILRAQVSNILKIKELQDSLSRENNLLENLIKNSINQAIITDTNFVVLSGGTQYLPINRNEYLFGFLNSCGIKYPENKIRDFSRNTEKNIKFSFSYNDKFFNTVISKVYSNIGLLELYIVSIEDVTQDLLIAEQKETFIATLTHDLKSPIRAEQNILQQLLDEKFGTLNDEQKIIISEMLKSREYTKRMVDNILTRYKVTSKKFEILPEKNSYKQTIENAVKEISPIISDKKQELEISYKAKTDEFVFDRIETTRVLVNLLSNASEYTPNSGKITVCVSESEDKIITSVADNGYGISESDIDFIFDKNVTLAKKYRKVGSGLGLYISKSIINAHGGEITVTSKLNQGSTFTFSLPKTLKSSELLNYAETQNNN